MDIFEGTIATNVATKKKQQQFLMLLKSMKTQIHQIMMILNQARVIKKNQALKTSRKLIKRCMIIGSRYVM